MNDEELEKYEFIDRYSATGTPYPDPETMCLGPCEGMGVYPHYKGDEDETPHERLLWEVAHNAPNAHDMRFDNGGCDGCHFIQCYECGGTGKKP